MHNSAKETIAANEGLDLSVPDYAALASAAARISKPLDLPVIQTNANLAGSFDDFLGAVYALIFAKRADFTDRPARPIDITAVRKRSAQIAAGELRSDGKWMAGYYFNSGLFRIAAIYQGILKIVVGRLTTGDDVPTLRTQAENLYREWTRSPGPSERLDLLEAWSHTKVPLAAKP